MQSAVSWFAVLEDFSVGSFEWLLLHSLHISLTGCHLPSESPPFFFLFFHFPSGIPLSISCPSDSGYLVAKWAGPQTIFFVLWLAYLLILSGEVALEYTASFMCCCSTFSPWLWTLAYPISSSVSLLNTTVLTAVSWSRKFRLSFLS